MADTSELLPQLPPPSIVLPVPYEQSVCSESPFSGHLTSSNRNSDLPDGAEIVHYPVLVPNMRGFQNLLKLEDKWRSEGGQQRLTDEIAVFVSATEVRIHQQAI